MSNAQFNNLEIIQIAEAVAREKGIAKQSVLEALEHAIEFASKRKYGNDNKIKVQISSNGEISIARERTVVEVVNNSDFEISLTDALRLKSDAAINGVIIESLPPIDLGRITAQDVKQVVVQKVREAEREKQYAEFKDRQGEIICGVVKRFEFDNIILDLDRSGEGLLQKSNTIKGENFKIGDRVKAYIQEVKRDNRGPQVILSRTSPWFLAKLFAQEVPEVYDKIIEVKAVARDPGSKSKVAVYSSDANLDPVGACVGVRGSRIQAIINELHSEKIDIVKWTKDPAKFVIGALSPAKVSKVIVDEDERRMEVVLPQDQLSLAIGRKGQNVRLASQLTGWAIDIMTEDEESKRRTNEFQTASQLFITKLELEEVLAQLLAAEGFSKVEDLARVSTRELCAIEGIHEDLAAELISRAQEVVLQDNKRFIDEIGQLGVDQELSEFLNNIIPTEKIAVLAKGGIKSFEDLEDLSPESFRRLFPSVKMSEEELKRILNHAKSKIAGDNNIDIA
jgi:N utilization substance protein A